jgi:integrase
MGIRTPSDKMDKNGKKCESVTSVTESVTDKTAPLTKQRAKRLTPRFYASRKKWVVDLPPDLNDGVRSQKFFDSKKDASRWCANHALKRTLGIVTAKVERSKQTNIVRGLVTLYLAGMESDGLAADGIKQAKTALTRFSSTFGALSPKDIGHEDIEGWLGDLNLGTRNSFNHFVQARQFFNWPTIRKMVPSSPFLLLDTPPKTDKDARKEILTPDQMRDLLKLDVEPWIKCKIVLGGFAGLRTCELARMTYESVDEEFSEIIVTREQSKQGKAMRPRSVTLQAAVLRHLPKGTGPLLGASKEWRCHRGMPEEARLGAERFPQNALRHSFASYHLAHFKDAVKTAFEMGHTNPKLLYETYANSVSRRDAAAWWDL